MTAKFCPTCGRPRTGARFCPGCGRDFGAVGPGADPAPSTEPAAGSAQPPVAGAGPAEDNPFAPADAPDAPEAPAEQNPFTARPAPEAPTEHNPFATRSAPEAPTEQNPFTARSEREAPAEQNPFGARSEREAPAEQNPFGARSEREAPAEQPTQTVIARPVGPAMVAAPIPPPTAAAPPPPPGAAAGPAYRPTRASGSRRRALLILAGVIVLLGAGGGAYALATGGKQPSGHPSALAARTTAPPTRPASTQPAPPSESATASAAPSPTPTPTATATPTPTPTPTPSVVSIAAGVKGASSAQLEAVLTHYFTGINRRDYAEYASSETAQGRANEPESTFDSGYATTKDSAMTVKSLTSAGNGGLIATVTVTSRQATSDSVDGSSCNDWTLYFYLVRSGAGYLISPTPPGYDSTYTDC